MYKSDIFHLGFINLYIQKPNTTPIVFNITSSISVLRPVNNWVISINNVIPNPKKNTLGYEFIRFQTNGAKNPNGENNTTLATKLIKETVFHQSNAYIFIVKNGCRLIDPLYLYRLKYHAPVSLILPIANPGKIV